MRSDRWLIVSNRLPLRYDRDERQIVKSSGGLVTALEGVKTNTQMLWLGAFSAGEHAQKVWKKHANKNQQKQFKPIFIDAETYDAFYDEICNRVFWPLFHYESQFVNFSSDAWKAYKAVNIKFCEAILSVAKEHDQIWVHDYHLFLLPQLLKKALGNKVKVGFFLHTPFPTSEIFRQLPVREEVLEALLQADLIGFHDYSYLRHFCNSVYSVLGISSSQLQIPVNSHSCQLGVFPVSINANDFVSIAKSRTCQSELNKLKKTYKGKQIVLGIDRQDYSKGLLFKLKAFRKLLSTKPKWHGKVSLVQIAVPSRIFTTEYQELKKDIDQLCGEINSEFGTLGWTPVEYLFNTVSKERLVALYRLADALVVSSTRDGMNLVSFEYIASQSRRNPGVLLLSEFAGSSGFLNKAMIINPWNVDDFAAKLDRALSMPLEERCKRHHAITDFLTNYTASTWASSFMRKLKSSIDDAHENPSQPKLINASTPLLKKGKKTLIFIDYDGTLVPIKERPELAVLTKEQRRTLCRIFNKEHLTFVVVSGRDRRFMSEQLEEFNCDLVAEHGAFLRQADGKSWRKRVSSPLESWYPAVKSVMTEFSHRTPGSFVEQKKFALCWHYRLSSRSFAEYQARQLIFELNSLTANLPVSVLHGKCVVEVRAMEATKGSFVSWYLSQNSESHKSEIIAMGDDTTDEEMFSVLGGSSKTIKVGSGVSCARYRLRSQNEVIPLLKHIAGF